MPDKKHPKSLLVIIDGNALVHRAYHAYPPTLKTTDGMLVNAAFGFTSMLLRVLRDFKPDYVVCTFDTSKPTFRHTKFSGYKANRGEADEELVAQFPIVWDIVKAFNIPIFAVEGYEADDLIGTISKVAEKHIDILIVTGDQDILQLVDDRVHVLLPGKRFSDPVEMDIESVRKKYGFGPNKIIDYKALRGDPSDNIPGVRGIGEKMATQLLTSYNDIDDIYANISKLKPRLQKLLSEGQEEAYLSKDLATIDRNVPIDFQLESCRLSEYDKKKVLDLFQRLEFRSLISKLPESTLKSGQQSLFSQSSEGGNLEKEDGSIYKDNVSYILIDKQNEVLRIIEKINGEFAVFAFDTETDGLDPINANLIGLSISFKSNEAYYIPRRVIIDKSKLTKAGAEVKKLFENRKIRKVAHNAKFDMHILKNIGINVDGLYFDTMIASFIASYGKGRVGLKELAFNKLGMVMEDITDLKGAKKSFDIHDISEEVLYKYACRDADATYQLFLFLAKELLQFGYEKDKLAKNLDHIDNTDALELIRLFDRKIKDQVKQGKFTPLTLFSTIEMPLVGILAGMERSGIHINSRLLKDFGADLEEELNKLEKDIYKTVGHEFNLRSSKQLGEVLFEELDLPKTKKLKNGGYSTNETFLEKLKGLHPIINLILRYRELYKLKSTYIDSLLRLVDKNTKKIHTTYSQTVTVTGRLSSFNPNLQNIPTRTQIGQKIREAFIPQKGNLFVGFDYSQQEMRILAHLSEEDDLIEAFRSGVDIHKFTAAKVFDKDIDEVNKEERMQAKTINFGMIYGISGFGLSNRLEIPVEVGNEFIEKFFDTFPKIRAYYDRLLDDAMKNGYVQTMFGRRKDTVDLNSSNHNIRKRAFRETINFPIQGSASDIVKKAMIQVDDVLKNRFEKARMLLQVHDELIFEVPEDERFLKSFTEEIASVMQNVVELRVENKVEYNIGGSWRELK